MQITEKLRHEILLSFPKKGNKPSLAVADADVIAVKCKVKRLTVYKEWRLLRTTRKPIQWNPINVAIAELAKSKRDEQSEIAKRANAVTKQFSSSH